MCNKINLPKIFKFKINRVRDELEEELRVQLKRQLAAHQDHLQEQLQVRTHELNRRHQLTLEDTILLEASRYQSELSDSLNRLQTIEAILKGYIYIKLPFFISLEV